MKPPLSKKNDDGKSVVSRKAEENRSAASKNDFKWGGKEENKWGGKEETKWGGKEDNTSLNVLQPSMHQKGPMIDNYSTKVDLASTK